MFNDIQDSFTRLRLRARRFQRDESGALIVFGLMVMVLMLMIGGLAVDLMRYENTRTKLQNTLDRATLAAASLDQKLVPASVVQDYMQKAGLMDQMKNVQVTEGMNQRVVHTTGLADTQPFFLHLLGINKFDAPAASQAEQAISNVEIVLVLDVSGSMSGQKIASLKVAADEFVDTVTANDTHHKVSIAIVPYNAQVNIGPQLAAKFNLTNRAGVTDVNCVEIPSTAAATQALSLTAPMPMMAYADIVGATSKVSTFVSPIDVSFGAPSLVQTGAYKGTFNGSFCPPSKVNVVRLPGSDPTKLKSQIDAMVAGGNTSITLGMKWGVTLLDPSMQPVYAQFIASGDMQPELAGRPLAYDPTKVLKIIVLMTDGEHVAHNRITDAYKTGPSPIYRAGDGNYSIQFTSGRPTWAGSNTWFVPHLSKWQSTAYAGGGTAVQQDWAQIWANMRQTYVAWQFYARALGSSATSPSSSAYNNAISAMVATYAQVNEMDASLQTSCNQARANGVQIYGITIEAPTHGNEVITNCADPDRTFISDRNTIRSVFQTIAANLTQLRLTQ